MIIEFKGMRPDVEKATFIADSATLSGDIHLAENTSVWFGASVRAEVASITIGRDSNVQDNAMLHADYDLPITIGERVSVGHNAIVHGATIEDDVIVGMHATVMNGAHVGRGSIIAAGALIKEHAGFPSARWSRAFLAWSSARLPKKSFSARRKMRRCIPTTRASTPTTSKL